MSLRVRCPEGCILHASMARCGKVVRCPKCETMIRIPEISIAESKDAGTVECCAERYNSFVDNRRSLEGSPRKELPSRDPTQEVVDSPRLPVAKPRQHTSSRPKQELPSVSVELVGERLRKKQPDSQQAFVSRKAEQTIGVNHIETTGVAAVGKPILRENLNLSLVGSADGKSSEINEEKSWEERLTRANADRFFLAKMFAVGLIFIGLLNLIPVFTQLISWGGLSGGNEIPNWLFLQIGVCLLIWMYAIFLFQINDWSALRSVSISMLVLAFVYGLCCTGLLLGGNEGSVAMLLEISTFRVKQATSGFAVMLCLATLMSYWAAREASNWQRAEQVLKQIVLKRTH